MSKLVDDVKSGLKGIRGAGDAVRGGVLEATDQAFEKNPHEPETIAHEQKNRAIAEKGKQDIRGADEMIARHEWEHKGTKTPSEQGTIPHSTTSEEPRLGKGANSGDHPLAQARQGPVLPRDI